jgi:hypothetical protein
VGVGTKLRVVGHEHLLLEVEPEEQRASK